MLGCRQVWWVKSRAMCPSKITTCLQPDTAGQNDAFIEPAKKWEEYKFRKIITKRDSSLLTKLRLYKEVWLCWAQRPNLLRGIRFPHWENFQITAKISRHISNGSLWTLVQTAVSLPGPQANSPVHSRPASTRTFTGKAMCSGWW